MADTKKINDWLQIIGMFGLIASLIFVGMQIKQDHEIALSGVYQARNDISVQSSMDAINSPAFLNASAKIYANRSDELTMQEAVAFEYYIGATMNNLENNHQQFLMGYLSEEHWQRNIRELECILDLPISRQIVSVWDFRSSFEKLVAEIIEKVVREPSGCWGYDWSYSVAE